MLSHARIRDQMRTNLLASGNYCKKERSKKVRKSKKERKKVKKTVGSLVPVAFRNCTESRDRTVVKKPGADAPLASYFLLSGLPQNTAKNR